MDQTHGINMVFYAGTLLLFSFVLARTARKHRERRNNATRWLFFILFFNASSLLLVVINTVFEYILDLYPSSWTWGFTQPGAWLHYLQYVLQFSCGRDAMILVASVFLSKFYEEVFVHGQETFVNRLLVVYRVLGFVFIGFILGGVYFIDFLQFGLDLAVSPGVAVLTEAKTKVLVVLVHALAMYIPIFGHGLALRRRLAKGPRTSEDRSMMRKFTCIVLMVCCLAGTFLFALLDAMSADTFPAWFYATIISACMAALLAYFGFVMELEHPGFPARMQRIPTGNR